MAALLFRSAHSPPPSASAPAPLPLSAAQPAMAFAPDSASSEWLTQELAEVERYSAQPQTIDFALRARAAQWLASITPPTTTTTTAAAASAAPVSVLHHLLHHFKHTLPSFAVPLVLRVRTAESRKTATLKFQKFEYQTQGFDPLKAVALSDSEKSSEATAAAADSKQQQTVDDLDLLFFRFPNVPALSAVSTSASATASTAASTSATSSLPPLTALPQCSVCGGCEQYVPLTPRLYRTIIHPKFPL
jgi:hypothetical protein